MIRHTGFSALVVLVMASLFEISPKTLRCLTTPSFLAATFVDSLFSSWIIEADALVDRRVDLVVVLPLRIIAATLAWLVVGVVSGGWDLNFQTRFYIRARSGQTARAVKNLKMCVN